MHSQLQGKDCMTECSVDEIWRHGNGETERQKREARNENTLLHIACTVSGLQPGPTSAEEYSTPVTQLSSKHMRL